MSKKSNKNNSRGHGPPISTKAYKSSLHQKYWKAYSSARNEMLARAHNPTSPWTLERAKDKRLAPLNIIKDVLSRLHYADKDDQLGQPNPQIVFAYDLSNLENGQLAK
jgi:polyphosphate kinase 2 (PPK2 family)